MKLHWYKSAFKSYCGIDIKDFNYTGLANIDACTCLKCLDYFIRIRDKDFYNHQIKQAEKRLSELTYERDFAKLIK